jgi:hypothetical protein
VKAPGHNVDGSLGRGLQSPSWPEVGGDARLSPGVEAAVGPNQARRVLQIPALRVRVHGGFRLAVSAGEGEAIWGGGEVERALALPVLSGDRARDDGGTV